LRGLATKLANFYEPVNIPQEYSQVGKNLAINYTPCCEQVLKLFLALAKTRFVWFWPQRGILSFP
jgi:hypothetical protein